MRWLLGLNNVIIIYFY